MSGDDAIDADGLCTEDAFELLRTFRNTMMDRVDALNKSGFRVSSMTSMLAKSPRNALTMALVSATAGISCDIVNVTPALMDYDGRDYTYVKLQSQPHLLEFIDSAPRSSDGTIQIINAVYMQRGLEYAKV